MEWKTAHGLTEYPDALGAMAARVAAIQKGQADELVWLVEHPPLYTLGTSAKAADVLGGSIPSYETGRGGQVTYHGPGQRVVYLMLDLKSRARMKGAEPDLRAYVKQLEQWIILTLAQFGIEGFIREGRVGVWVEESPVASRQSPFISRQSPVVSEAAAGAVVPPPLGGRLGGGLARADADYYEQTSEQVAPPPQPSPYRGGGERAAPIVPTRHGTSVTTHRSRLTAHEKKIAALGVRVQKWVTSHGIAINVNPDLSHYAGIIPCGIREFGVTSMRAMGADVGMDAVDRALKETFTKVFKQ